MMEARKETMPIMITVKEMEVSSSREKENPTASASILVATERMSTRFREVMSTMVSPLSRTASQIILPPMNVRMAKAIQGANREMNWEMVTPNR